MQALFLIVGIPSVNKGWMKWCLRLNVQYNLWFCLLKFRTRAWMAFIKWKETFMCPCPWLCGVVVGSVGASGCLEGLGAAAGLLLDSFKTEVSHSAATTLWLLLESPHTLTARFTHSGSSGFVGKKNKCAFRQLPLTCWCVFSSSSCFPPSKHRSFCSFFKLHFSFSFFVSCYFLLSNNIPNNSLSKAQSLCLRHISRLISPHCELVYRNTPTSTASNGRTESGVPLIRCADFRSNLAFCITFS